MVESAGNGEALGWEAIDRAMAKLYGDAQPAHWGTAVPFHLGGEDPLHGVSAYRSEAGRPHWHYVTYGLTELFDKETDDPGSSGFGFELTFRLARTAEETAPPVWPVSLLQNLARYVFHTGNVFSPGHHMNANGPIHAGSATALRALAFTADPALPPQRSSHGAFELVQVVGVTLDELEAAQIWNVDGLLDLARQREPQLVTDLSRGSWLADPQVAAHVRTTAQRAGSSCSALYNPRFGFDEHAGTYQVHLGASQIALFVQLLPGRLLHGNALRLVGKEQRVRFEPAAATHATLDEDGNLVLGLTPADVAAIAKTLEPRAAEYVAAGLSWRVEKSLILDEDGNVVQEIG